MPPYIVVPAQQTSIVVSPAVLEPGIPAYSFGSNNDYANAPNSNQETAEVLPVNGTAGRQFNLRKFPGAMSNERGVTWEYEFPSAPVSCGVALQGAIRDFNLEYVTIDSGASASGEVRAVPQDKIAGFNFLRIVLVTASGGTAPTIIAKMSF